MCGTFFIYQKASLEIYNFMKSRNIDSAWPDFIKAVGSKNLQHFESDIKAIDFLVSYWFIFSKVSDMGKAVKPLLCHMTGGNQYWMFRQTQVEDNSDGNW